MPLDFQFKELPLSMVFQKATRRIGVRGMAIFWNHPIFQFSDFNSYKLGKK